MRGLLWTVKAVAAAVKEGVYQIHGQMAATSSLKLEKKFPSRRLLVPTHGDYLPGITAA